MEEESALLQSMLCLQGGKDLDKIQGHLRHCKQDPHRLQAVQWMKKTSAAYGFTAETRDLSVQLLDCFLMESLHRHPQSLANITVTLYAAATSLILASKLLEWHPLSMSSFRHFPVADMAIFEKHFLKIINFDVSPLTTPTSFALKFIRCWPAHDKVPFLLLQEVVEKLIGKFWEVPESMSFNPSTVGLAALLLSFSQLRLDCTEMLAHLPAMCFTPELQPCQGLDSMLDVDRCLQLFFKTVAASATTSDPIAVEATHKTVRKSTSPTGVQEMGEGEGMAESDFFCPETSAAPSAKRRRQH